MTIVVLGQATDNESSFESISFKIVRISSSRPIPAKQHVNTVSPVPQMVDGGHVVRIVVGRTGHKQDFQSALSTFHGISLR